jgi:hypothetical protein
MDGYKIRELFMIIVQLLFNSMKFRNFIPLIFNIEKREMSGIIET